MFAWSSAKKSGISGPCLVGAENPESTGLEPATSAVTGRRSNRLSYDSFGKGVVIMTDKRWLATFSFHDFLPESGNSESPGIRAAATKSGNRPLMLVV